MESAEGDANRHARQEALYVEMRRLATLALRTWPRNGSLQATALVHEAYLRMCKGAEGPARLDELLLIASSAMRSVLVDHARARGTRRRDAGPRVPLDDVCVAYEERGGDLVVLDEALARLAGFDPVMARAVDLVFFGGVSHEETARQLGISSRTFQRRWSATCAWLRAELK